MDKQLPMYQEQLENFIYHHIHAWAEDYVLQNKDDNPDVNLYEAMESQNLLPSMQLPWNPLSDGTAVRPV